MIGDLLGGVTVTKQTVLLGIVGTVIIGGAGLGVLGPELGLGTAPVDTTEPAATPTATPTPPPVSATAPGTATPAPTATNEPTEVNGTDPTGTAADTATPTPSDEDDDDDDDTDDARFRDPAVSLSVADPGDVTNDGGTVGAVEGEVTARATWAGEVDTVVFVVSARQPEESWTEIARGAVYATGDGATLADAVDRRSFTYVDAANASALDNPTNATVVTRTGSVAVTAVFFDDGERVGRTQRVRTYSLDVANTGAVDLAVDGSAARGLSVADLAPGATAERRVTVRNRGNASGSLRLALANRTATEGGLAEPEAATDDPNRVELYDALELRVWVAGANASDSTYLAGGPETFVPLRSVDDALGSVDLAGDETVTVVVEWRLPVDTGNAVMTDAVGFDLELTLTSDGLG